MDAPLQQRILVLCTGNSCRSQMAEGWLRYFAGDGALVYSAGIESHGVHPLAVQVMQEAGIDISHQTSKTIDQLPQRDFDIVITVCDNARELCPYFPARVRQLHRDFHDPANVAGQPSEVLDAFRNVRDQLKVYCQSIIIQYLKGKDEG